MSRSVRQGLALEAEEDAQRFRRLINLRAAGKRLPAFYSRTPQAPSSPSPLARPRPNPSCPVRPLRSRCLCSFPPPPPYFSLPAAPHIHTLKSRLGLKEEITSLLSCDALNSPPVLLKTKSQLNYNRRGSYKMFNCQKKELVFGLLLICGEIITGVASPRDYFRPISFGEGGT